MAPVSFGKNQFHIGIWEMLIIIGTIVGGTWTLGILVGNFKDKQDKMYNAVMDKAKKDSLRDARIENNTKHIYAVEGKTDTNTKDIADLKKAVGFRRVQRFYTETKDEAGRIRVHPYNN